MNPKDNINKIYKEFSEFVAAAAERELEYFIQEAKYTTAFNYRIKKLVQDLKEKGNVLAELSIMFDTEGDVALLDGAIIGNFIGDVFVLLMQTYYRNTPLQKILSQVLGGTEKVKQDFVVLSYDILFKVLGEIYQKVTCRKEILNSYRSQFCLESYAREDGARVVGALLILEDICKYIKVSKEEMLGYVKEKVCP